jgi:hypothetical protein
MTKSETNAAKILGRKGGLSRSEAKVRAAKENGKKGGAPKNPPHDPEGVNADIRAQLLRQKS